MLKSNAIIKTDKAENWDKAVNYIPDKSTILIFDYDDGSFNIKLGDGVHKVKELPFLDDSDVIKKYVENATQKTYNKNLRYFDKNIEEGFLYVEI